MSHKIRVSSRAIIVNEDKILLNCFGNGLYYNFPGGGIEENETAKQAVVREVMEESGLAVEVGELVFSLEYEPASCNDCSGKHHISFFFRCYLNNDVPSQIPSHTDIDPDDPSITSETIWIPLSELDKVSVVPKICDPLIKYLETGIFKPSFWAECEHMVFKQNLEDEKTWGNITKQIDVFRPLLEKIFEHESLPLDEITAVKQSTNAVFKIGNMIVKIFKPEEPGNERCYKSELFGQTRASSLGVSVPKVIASGVIKDKYDFSYIISEFINGEVLSEIFDSMSSDEKQALGQKLRDITDKLNTACEQFNHIVYPEAVISEGYEGWMTDIGYRKSFLDERRKHIQSLGIKKSDLVFCHGDMALCNILYDSDGGVYLIDFACSLLSPICVDHVYLAFWADFNKDFLHGYFGEISIDELSDICLDGFLLSVNGTDLLVSGTGYGFIDGKAYETLEELKTQMREYIEKRYRYR